MVKKVKQKSIRELIFYLLRTIKKKKKKKINSQIKKPHLKMIPIKDNYKNLSFYLLFFWPKINLE